MTEIADVNREHFDKEANNYDNKLWVNKLYERLTHELISRKDWIGVPWIEDSSDEEEDAAGEGGGSSKKKDESRTTFLPYTTSCTGVDISSGMVNLYNERASQQGLEPSEMRAVVGDLAAAIPDSNLVGPEFFGFDLAIVGLGFHHFADPALAAKRLVERLKPGSGVLLIIDFLPHEPFGGHSCGQGNSHGYGHGHGQGRSHQHSHGHQHEGHIHVQDDKGEELVPGGMPKAAIKTVAHNGFSEEKIKEVFAAAGSVDIEVQVLGEGISFGERDQVIRRDLFLARGTRKA